MAIGVIRDHHNLRRNLNLNSNYISNDGGDEGISMTDAGDITLSAAGGDVTINDGTIPIFTFNAADSTFKIIDDGDNPDDYFQIDVEATGVTTISTVDDGGADGHLILSPDGALKLNTGVSGTGIVLQSSGADRGKFSFGTADECGLLAETNDLLRLRASGTGGVTIDTTGTGDITIDSGGALTIDKDIDNTTAGTTAGLTLDYDRVGAVTSGTDRNTGINLDVNATGAGTSGTPTVNTIGIDMDVIGDNAGSGTSTVTGLDVNVSGADTNYAIITTGGNVGIGVTDPASPLEIFSTSSQLKLSYDASNYADISVADDGHLEIATTGTDGDITLDSANSIMLEAVALYVYPSAATVASLVYGSAPPKLTINSADEAGDEFSIQVNAEGATTITTVDADTAVAHLDFVVDGHLDFNNSSCGFTQLTVTFGASGVIEDIGNSTDIDFRRGNKAWLELTGNLGALNNINLIFPAVSGNFVLVLEQDGTGSRTIHADAWEGNMYTSDGSTTATTANPLWAGGTAPTLTTDADYFDIISFYWDAVNERVFAVPTLNFS